jgi:hypothetical protein
MEASGSRLILYGPKDATINLDFICDVHWGNAASDKKMLQKDINEIFLRFKDVGEMSKDVYEKYAAWIKDKYKATGVVAFNKMLDDNFIDHE